MYFFLNWNVWKSKNSNWLANGKNVKANTFDEIDSEILRAFSIFWKLFVKQQSLQLDKQITSQKNYYLQLFVVDTAKTISKVFCIWASSLYEAHWNPLLFWGRKKFSPKSITSRTCIMIFFLTFQIFLLVYLNIKKYSYSYYE